MTMFDGYVAVDWSAARQPAVGKNSIWIAHYDAAGKRALVNPSTRQGAMNYIGRLLNKSTEEGLRLLCGFDFAFGYPVGTAKMLTGQSGWQSIWRRIAGAIVDNPNNWNNRFMAAAELNKEFSGEGPFWGRHQTWEIKGLPVDKPNGWGKNLPPQSSFR